jgi:tRNA nucleotidyltransferase (CCA-adding enzyme)
MIEAFKQAIPVLEKIEQAGFEAYFVGGSVRDYLLKKNIDDVDIATSGTPEEIKELFPKTVDIGIEHGTVLVLFNGQPYEITTFRSESEYEDFRRPKNVEFIRSLYEDLKRRDFTMNAIAMNRKGDLIDPFSGFDAIKNKIIQTVGAPSERFSEDALRIMRAIRFVSQLSFTIENDTFSALQRHASLLENISIERKTKEFEKILCGKDRRKSIQMLIEAGLHPYLPGLNNKYEGLKTIKGYTCEDLLLNEMWAFLVFTLTIPCISFLKGWRLSNQKMKEVEKLVSYLEKRVSKNWCDLTLFQAGEDISVSVEKVYQVITDNISAQPIDMLKKRHQSLPIKNRGELAVTGQDLMLWKDESGGPWLRQLLEKIEQAVVLRDVPNEKEAIREWLFRCNPR